LQGKKESYLSNLFEGKSMKFDEFIYNQPDMSVLSDKLKNLIQNFKNSSSFEEQDQVLSKINELRKHFETMSNIAFVRYTKNTFDKYFEQQQNYFDEINPIYENMIGEFYKALLQTKFKPQLQKKYGNQIFNIANARIKTTSSEVLDELKLENKLTSEYRKILSQAKIPFDKKENTLSQMVYYFYSQDRSIRKSSNKAYWDFFEKHSDQFSSIYDKLVKTRTSIAKKLGFNNFIELAYFRLNRTDYNSDDVRIYRDEVKKYIVPLSQKIYEKQKKRLGLEKLNYYDEPIFYKSGNPIPEGSSKDLLEKAKKMYDELSAETSDFYRYMLCNDLLDVESRAGKAPIGYCTFISDYRSPFIFANFNGTIGDVGVLTHEAGHAFQVFNCQDHFFPEYYFPTYEAAEIYSMSMQFFTYPWIKLFFGDKKDKYFYQHISSAINSIPYGVSVDEFQHFVYENPSCPSLERNKKWIEIIKKYNPHTDYSENPDLEKGISWYRQTHIFEVPFYYIDYTLAQICAIQFWIKMERDKKSCWKDYLNICKIGGSKSFLEILKEGNLESPFKLSCMKNVSIFLQDYIDSIDDLKIDF